MDLLLLNNIHMYVLVGIARLYQGYHICLQVQTLSGGELQRTALVLCLGKPADVYLIDEPSAYLDSEQRLHAAKVIKRYVLNILICWIH